MSSLAGVWNFNGQPVDRGLLERFRLAMGQDASENQHLHTSGSASLIYQAFHTTAESRLERQPYLSPSGLFITWDGRLDNRQDLLAELSGSVSRPHTDVDIFAAAFERWGSDCFRRLRGDWAAGIWQPDTWTLVLAVDYAGIRHLHYYLTSEKVMWCTGLEPILLSAGSSFTLNDEYVAGFLVAYPDVGMTPYREIRSVCPGTFVQFKGRKATCKSFWTLLPSNRIRYKADSEYEEHFRHVFRQAVRRRLRSDSPILADLSGGLDSSSIVCMADHIIASGEANPPVFETKSFYCPGEPTEDDLPFFSAVEKKLGKQGHHIKVEEFGGPAFLNYTKFIAVPGSLGDSPTPRGAQQHSQQQLNHPVRLSGIGGDELLGGVPDPTSQLADLVVLLHFNELWRQLMAWSSVKRIPWVQLLSRTLVGLLPRPLRALLSKNAQLPRWIDHSFARRYRLAERRLGPVAPSGFWLPSRREYAQTVSAMIRQMAQKLSVLNDPVEVRYPYLDQDLVEFLASIPASQLLRPGERRSLMRRAMVNFLPPEVAQRRSKALGSRLPILTLNSRRDDLEKLFASSISARSHYVDCDHFLQHLRATKPSSAVQMIPVLRTISLELWLSDLLSRGLVRFPATADS